MSPVTDTNANMAEKTQLESGIEHIDENKDAHDIAGHAVDQEEHDDTIWQAVRRSPWACFWCLYACWTIILVSFDTQAAGAVVGIPEFRKDFGYA